MKDSAASGLAAVLTAERAALLRFFTARTGDPAEAEDVVQEIWLKLAGAEPGPVAEPRAYLRRMGLNIVVDRNRERQRRRKREAGWTDLAFERIGGDAIDDRPDPLSEADGRRQLARLSTAIAGLPPGAGRVFRMHKLEGMSHAEVAAALGISRSAVEKHMAVALKHLSLAMGD